MQHKGLKYWARAILAMADFAGWQDRRKVIAAGLYRVILNVYVEEFPVQSAPSADETPLH